MVEIAASWGAPIFSPEVPKYLFFKGLGTSGRKIGAPQKRQIQPKHRQVTDLDVTDLGFLGPRIPFCATGALGGRVTPFSRSLF